MSMLKIIVLLQVFNTNTILAANEVDSFKDNNKSIEKCEKLLKTRKLSKDLKLSKSKNLKSEKLLKF